MKKAILMALTLLSLSTFAQTFKFVGKKPTSVGSIELFAPASTIQVFAVGGFRGKYFSINLADDEGDLIQIASKDRVKGRGLGYYWAYSPRSGNYVVPGTGAGKNLSESDLAGLTIQFGYNTQMDEGSVIIQQNGKTETFAVKKL